MPGLGRGREGRALYAAVGAPVGYVRARVTGTGKAVWITGSPPTSGSVCPHLPCPSPGAPCMRCQQTPPSAQRLSAGSSRMCRSMPPEERAVAFPKPPSAGIRPLLRRRRRLRGVLSLHLPRILPSESRQPRPEIRQVLCGAGETVLDTASLELVRRTHSVDGHPPIGQFDPPVLRRHCVGQRIHVRLQQRPVLLKCRHPILRQSALRTAGLSSTQPPRFLLQKPHTVRVASPSAQV